MMDPQDGRLPHDTPLIFHFVRGPLSGIGLSLETGTHALFELDGLKLTTRTQKNGMKYCDV